MKDGWKPIETAPKDGTWIILYHVGLKLGVWYWDGGVWNDDSMIWSERDGCGPSHWMPLPPEPKKALKD